MSRPDDTHEKDEEDGKRDDLQREPGYDNDWSRGHPPFRGVCGVADGDAATAGLDEEREYVARDEDSRVESRSDVECAST